MKYSVLEKTICVYDKGDDAYYRVGLVWEFYQEGGQVTSLCQSSQVTFDSFADIGAVTLLHPP